MKTKFALSFLPFLLFTQWHCGNGQDLHKIVPLKSTRAEVERLLGSTKGSYGVTYQLKEGSLSIEYSSGPCKRGREGGWNVPENVVVSFSFSPRHKKRVADLKLDPKQFRKVIDQHVLGVIYYINDEDGITYEIQQGKVDSVEYGPPKKYDHLYCGDIP
jgi:hypothetical protein